MDCTHLRDDMLAVLYGEADPDTALRFEQHLKTCTACGEELEALRQVRRNLAVWSLPPLTKTRVIRPPIRLPRWLAVAAALLVGIGGAFGLSGSELRFESGRFAFRLGRGPADVHQLLAEQETRHRREMDALRASLAAPREDEAFLHQVQDLIRESEARQAVLLNASFTDLTERTESQRRLDLARMSAGLSYLEGRTGERWARTTELMGYVLQASQQR